MRHGYEDFVRLSFCSDHPMRFRIEQEEELKTVLLNIDPRVAGFAETRFSNINATDSSHMTGDDLTFLKEHVDLEATRQTYVSRDNPAFKPHQAEILVKHFIPLEFITNFEAVFL